jgi:hypothetical protein
LTVASNGSGDPVAGENAAPLSRDSISIRTDGRIGAASQPPPTVARLNDVLKVASSGKAGLEDTATAQKPALREEVAPAPSPEGHAAVPSHVGSDQLREAFWFEQASAFVSTPPPAPAPKPEPDVLQADKTSVEPEPAAAEPCPAPESSLPVWGAEARSRWVAAACLLALIGLLVALLTGRNGRSAASDKTV